MNFGNVTHIIENPSGHAPGYNFSLVGAVPAIMLEPRKPTMSDIMGGRAQKDGFAYHGKPWETVQTILDFAADKPEVKLCNASGCSCRRLFPSGSFTAYPK